jgi:hypothetical protein
MLADGKIDSLDTHLEQFKLNDQSRHNDLTVCLYRDVRTNPHPVNPA